jgi:hypothetical protein
MKSLRRISLLLVLASQWGCDGSDGIGPRTPEFSATGVYRLRAIGFEPLPYALPNVVDSRGTRMSWLMGETLRLDADGRYHWKHTESPLGTSFDSAGVYTVVNDTTVDVGGRRVVVSGAVAMAVPCVEGRPCIFVREGADAGPSLTYQLLGLTAVEGVPVAQSNASVSGAQVWLWGDGRYRRHTSLRGLPGTMQDEGMYQLSGTTITLTPLIPVAMPDRQPLAGSYAGGSLSLGAYAYSPMTLP